MLPSYSPDFNPIEEVFAKVKNWLRVASDAIQDAVATLVAAIHQIECTN